MLIGETLTPPRRGLPWPEMLLGLGLASGVGAVAAQIATPDANVALAAGLAVLAGLGLVGAGRVERSARQRRRFVLHFGNEALRVDAPGGLRRPGRSWSAHFDDIADVYVLAHADGSHALVVELRPGQAPTQPEVLVDRVQDDELDELRRLWSLLRAAFGLTRPGPPAAE